MKISNHKFKKGDYLLYKNFKDDTDNGFIMRVLRNTKGKEHYNVIIAWSSSIWNFRKKDKHSFNLEDFDSYKCRKVNKDEIMIHLL